MGERILSPDPANWRLDDLLDLSTVSRDAHQVYMLAFIACELKLLRKKLDEQLGELRATVAGK